MVVKKGGKGRGGGAAPAMEDSVEELTRVPLQAILLADSFTTKFRPITMERPKVLLPLVNVAMIDHTLSWLESAGVEEVFVFCCAHAKQVINHLQTSGWFTQPNFSVTTIESNNATGAGDALRYIYDQNVIRGDFVLVSGDTVSNMSLAEALREHKERRKRDNNAILTMVVRQSKPSPVTRQSRLGTDELFMAIDPGTKQLLYYEESADKGTVSIDKTLPPVHPSIYLHNDKQDCYIDICSPEVLSTFADNFDYQHLRRHFLKGLLDDDIMGYKIFTHEIHSSYAARVDNFRSYDTVSKDIIQRWTYPLVPDVQFCGNCSSTKLDRQGTYRGLGIGQSRSAQIGPFTVIGSGTTVGNYSKVSNSVVGKGCKIGKNVSIDGSYIWHNVTVEDGCVLKNAIVCDGVIIKSGASLEPGAVLSYKVVVGEQFIVPAYSKVSLYQQPIMQDSDEELEYADNSNGTIDISSLSNTDDLDETTTQLSKLQLQAASEVGNGGVGFIWSTTEGSQEEEWRHSVAPIPAEKLLELFLISNDELEEEPHQEGTVPISGELERDSAISDSDDDGEVIYQNFEKEVLATFERAELENHTDKNVILEVNSLRLSYNLITADCAGALFDSIMKVALARDHSSHSELYRNAASLLTKWQKLLKYYLPSIDEEIEVIMKFEELCESAKEYAPLFVQVLHHLYNKDIVQEEAVMKWASEKENADECDKVFLRQAEKFIQWLNEASEEEEEED